MLLRERRHRRTPAPRHAPFDRPVLASPPPRLPPPEHGRAARPLPPRAAGTALNYKIVVRDAAVAAVLYQEDGRVRPSPFVEHRLPAAGSFVTLPDGALGRLGQLPRGLVVAREPRDLPEHPPQWAPAPGLRPKGKHPAELPGLVDVSIVQRGGAVVWPHHECSVPVCAITAADSARLRQWHAQWDAHLRARSAEAEGLAVQIEELLARSKAAGGSGRGSSSNGGGAAVGNGSSGGNGEGGEGGEGGGENGAETRPSAKEVADPAGSAPNPPLPPHVPDTSPTRPRHGPDTDPTRPRHVPDTDPTRPLRRS